MLNLVTLFNSAFNFLMITSPCLQLHCNLFSHFPKSVWVFIELMEHYFSNGTVQGGPINLRLYRQKQVKRLLCFPKWGLASCIIFKWIKALKINKYLEISVNFERPHFGYLRVNSFYSDTTIISKYRVDQRRVVTHSHTFGHTHCIIFYWTLYTVKKQSAQYMMKIAVCPNRNITTIKLVLKWLWCVNYVKPRCSQ